MDTKRWLRRLKYAAELKEKRVRLARLHQPTADVRCPTQGADASTIAFLGSEAHGKSVKPMAKGKSKGGKAGGSEASGYELVRPVLESESLFAICGLLS